LPEKNIHAQGDSSPNPTHRGNPAEYHINPEKGVVFVKFGKRVTAREIGIYALSLRADPSFRPEFSEIVDLREVQELDVKGDEMMNLAEKIDPFAMDAKRAFIVRDSVQQHAARMHQLLRLSKENIAIVHTLEEAERWIRLRGWKP